MEWSIGNQPHLSSSPGFIQGLVSAALVLFHPDTMPLTLAGDLVYDGLHHFPQQLTITITVLY